MDFFPELMSNILILVIRPFSVCKWVFMFGLKTIFSVIETGVQLVKASIDSHLYIFHKTIIWMIALITLPTRVLTALQRERLLQEHLHELQIQLESLVWDRKELRAQLQTAIKECRILESMLAEVEDENDSIIPKFELLEGELKKLKVENIQLKEILGKSSWKHTGNDTTDNEQNLKKLKVENIQLKEILGKSSWKHTGNDTTDNAQNVGIADSGVSDESSACHKGGGMILEELVMHKDKAWEGDGKSEEDLLSFSKTGAVSKDSIHSFSQCIVSVRDLNETKGVDEIRDVALSQSLFSAVLAFLVGIIIWNAEDSCMPLVIALFAVVCMSLKSVVQFFSTIKNRPASDAVALLSFNWFILGMLTYPALPTLVRVFAPLALGFFSRGH